KVFDAMTPEQQLAYTKTKMKHEKAEAEFSAKTNPSHPMNKGAEVMKEAGLEPSVLNYARDPKAILPSKLFGQVSDNLRSWLKQYGTGKMEIAREAYNRDITPKLREVRENVLENPEQYGLSEVQRAEAVDWLDFY